MRLIVDDTQVAMMAEAWKRAPDVVRGGLLSAMTEADALLEREVKEGTPVGVGSSGGLRGSIIGQEVVSQDQVMGIVSSPLPYADVVEFGRRPGKMPPVEPIRDWVEQVLGIRDQGTDDAATDVAWAIAKKIQKKGTLGTFMFQGALDANEDTIQRIFARAVDRILDEVLP